MKTTDNENDPSGLIAEVKRLAGAAKDYQTRHDLSTAQLIRKFPALGSDKTLGLLLKGNPEDLRELDLERWALDYRAAVNLIEVVEERADKEDPAYEDLSLVTGLRVAVMDAMRERGNNRLVMMQGPSGCGKSTAGLMLQWRYGTKRVVLLQADESWRNSLGAMLDEMLYALGRKHPPRGANAKLREVEQALNVSRICMVIDEAHHMAPANLNLVKTLINKTPGEFVLLAMDSLWRRLEGQNYEEARQLTQNRMGERIQIRTCDEKDIALMISRRTGVTAEPGLIRLVREKASKHGHLAFVKLVCRKARRLAGKEDPDAEHIARAVSAVEETR